MSELMDRIWIVSLLENRPYKLIKGYWRLFERRYNSTGVQIFSHPHITFQGGTTDNPGQLKKDFQEIVEKLKPFEIRVKGVACFDKQAIYLQVKKTRDLVKSYKLIYKFLKDNCSDLLDYCLPGIWTPHITLAMSDLSPGNFNKAWKEFKNLKIEFRQTLHNICLVRQFADDKIRLDKKYDI